MGAVLGLMAGIGLLLVWHACTDTAAPKRRTAGVTERTSDCCGAPASAR